MPPPISRTSLCFSIELFTLLPQGLHAVTAGCWRSPYENVAGVSTPSRRSIYGQDDIFFITKRFKLFSDESSKGGYI
jgi:hypothetical protein